MGDMNPFDLNAYQPSQLAQIIDFELATELLFECSDSLLCVACHSKIINVCLLQLPVISGSNSSNYAYCREFGHWREGFIIIHTLLLRESL